MKKYFLASLVAILAAGCHAQEKKQLELAQEKSKVSKSEPQGSWKVNREVDENGNLIKYDSIYSWSSSNGPENLSLEELDSINNHFSNMFGRNFSFGSGGIHGFSQNDSLLMKQFFEDGFDDSMFQHHFGGNMNGLQEIMKQMDSLQSLFFDKHKAQFLVPREEGSHEY